MADAGDTAAETAANRDLWTRASREYGDEHAIRAWAADDITWGIFNVPEKQLGVLGDVAGLDVVELGCGTAYFSAWLARRGARPTGVDLTPAQLATARRCRPAASTWPSRSAAPACGATRPAGYPRRPGCCGRAGGWSSTPPACWPPCAVPNRLGPPAANCCARSVRPAGWSPPRAGHSSIPATGMDRDPARQRLHRRRPARDLRPARCHRPPLLPAGDRRLGTPVAGGGNLGRTPRAVTRRDRLQAQPSARDRCSYACQGFLCRDFRCA